MFPFGIFKAKEGHDVIELLADGTRTTATTAYGSAVRLPRPENGVVFLLNMTDKAAAAGDTLDVYVQTLISATWVDVVHFTQQLGNGTNDEEYFAKICTAAAQAEFEEATALGAAAVRHVIGDEWKVKYTIVDAGGGTQSFRFDVQAIVC